MLVGRQNLCMSDNNKKNSNNNAAKHTRCARENGKNNLPCGMVRGIAAIECPVVLK